MAENRKHSAIMHACHYQGLSSAGRFTDIVGYTALMGSDEDRAFDVLTRNREIHTKLIEQFNGTLIKEMGDGMLVGFNNGIRDCATKIQKANKLLICRRRIKHTRDISFTKKMDDLIFRLSLNTKVTI
jgi:hypothetical protein